MQNELSGKFLILSFPFLKGEKKNLNLSIGPEEGKAVSEHVHKDGRLNTCTDFYSFSKLHQHDSKKGIFQKGINL